MTSDRLSILGQDPWRSLGHGIATRSEGEFPPGADQPPPGLDRRRFLARAGAGLALAGLTSCRTRAADRILPYSRQPPEVTPGIPIAYATSMVLGGYATGLVVETNEGRPTKIEGNPKHPASLGATSPQHQASLVELYDHTRASGVSEGRRPTSWEAFTRVFGATPPPGEAPSDGHDLHVVLEPTSSPLLSSLLDRLLERSPRATLHFWDPLASNAPLEAARTLFSSPLLPKLDLEPARVIVDLDGDLLNEGPLALAYARAWAMGRRPTRAQPVMNRLYVIEPTLSVTGSAADHRLPALGRRMPILAAALVRELVRVLGATAAMTVPPGLEAQLERLAGNIAERERAFVGAVARDLAKNPGASVVSAGERHPDEVHLLAELANGLLDNEGKTVHHIPSALRAAGESHDLTPLATALAGGRVGRLVILGGNPIYSAPRELELERLVAAVPRSVYLGPREDETARVTRWFVAEAHYLESWGDARAYDGTISLVQPMIEPLFGGRSSVELVAAFLEERASARELLARFAGPTLPEALKEGFVADSAFAHAAVAPDVDRAVALLASVPPVTGLEPTDLELGLRPDPKVRGGELAGAAWLLELPDPMTKISWGNAALLSPATARRYSMGQGDWVRLEVDDRRLEVPVFVLPGHADDAVTLHLGWGRRLGEDSPATGVGVDAYVLRTKRAPWFDRGLRLVKIESAAHAEREDRGLAITQEHWSMEGRHVAESLAFSRWLEQPLFSFDHENPPSLRREWPESGHQWGMAIDLGACTGCSACVVACQAENNILVVGKEEVEKSREMHWLRIDRYFEGPPEAPRVITQPMLCQHCEHAPCEYVCPVNATVHSEDGLNDMVYNRCIGTRFCSNNCPYKVRRFNWFDWSDRLGVTEKMAMNPDVTVRSRGVMEKCTFCVQRIRRADIDARIDGRTIADGELLTACQQACPTRAITFGDVADPSSRVSRLREDPRAYDVLHEQGTRPRVRYLARLRNENPELRGPRRSGP